jgi:short-subunit dehydrogenase
MRDPRSILITGASSGIGAALARLYARPGVALALGGRDRARLEAVAAACRAAGATVEAEAIDVTDAPALAAWLDACDRRRPFDLVVAGAGVIGGRARKGPPEALADAERLFAVNVGGTLNTVHPLLGAMAARGRGQVALMSSLMAIRPLPYAPAYAASKAAVKAYGEALRGAVKRSGISVSVICPGFVATPMQDKIDGPKPFQIDAERAARLIRRGLARNRPLIAFPLPLYVLTMLSLAVPRRVADWALSRVGVDMAPPEGGERRDGGRQFG